MKTLKNVEDINYKRLEKQLKPIENEIKNTNTKPFEKLGFLISLGSDARERLD